MMEYLKDKFEGIQNKDLKLHSRLVNYGLYLGSNDFWIIMDLTTDNIIEEFMADEEEAVGSLVDRYNNSPMLLLAEPDGTLWHDSSVVAKPEAFIANALKIHGSIEIRPYPMEYVW